jgi:predicted RNase H-like nuclease (RuvC/YqgF family)
MLRKSQIAFDGDRMQEISRKLENLETFQREIERKQKEQLTVRYNSNLIFELKNKIREEEMDGLQLSDDLHKRIMDNLQFKLRPKMHFVQEEDCPIYSIKVKSSDRSETLYLPTELDGDVICLRKVKFNESEMYAKRLENLYGQNLTDLMLNLIK